MARKNFDDLMVDMMIDLMKFPTSLVGPVGRVGTKLRDLDKHFEGYESEFKEFYEGLEKEFKEVSRFHVVKTDIIEKENKVIIKAEMPGFDKEDISISIEKEFLVISAESKEENLSEGAYISREIKTGKFQKVFDLEGFNKESISAKYENGILYVEIEKIEETKDEVRKIDIM